MAYGTTLTLRSVFPQKGKDRKNIRFIEPNPVNHYKGYVSRARRRNIDRALRCLQKNYSLSSSIFVRLNTKLPTENEKRALSYLSQFGYSS